MTSVYKINKGVNQPVMFRGLKAQYIWWLGGGLVLLLLTFAILYIIGINMFVCLGLIIALAMMLFKKVYAMSGKYGEHGLMKKTGHMRVPTLITNRSRSVFMKKRSYGEQQ
ncbi:DUF4133 domain-containing protein [Niabella ginsengisoli]|uniref:DUF4133 domain-containing protein n=1 Tax=Niabella ginsengisoli TaxID=522298 RepID=A0ABS9SHV6_9BACT|nr:DUF4133 domain-containing protein [Niabella ginsengisoli]MCH5597941.1 DUF4133 domain-containing protein [Niabella ginsengisoli]